MERILSLMKERGMTKSELSNRIGIRNQNFNGLLKNPTYETLSKIAVALDVPVWQLFASPEEARGDASIVCPKCGNRIMICAKNQ